MTMRKLMLKIEEDMKKRGIKKKDVATNLGVTPSAVTQYFKVEVPIDFIKFTKLLYLVYGFYPENLLFEYLNSVELKKEMLEWLAMHGKWNLLQQVIDKEKENHGREKRFVRIYELLLRRSKKQITPLDFLTEVEKIKFHYTGKEEIESKILINIWSLYSYIDLHVYSLIPAIAELTLQQVQYVDNSYLREAYEIRIKEIMVFSYMKRNQLKEAESMAEDILREENINKFPLQYNSALCMMSEMYVFRDFSKSLYYIQKALSMLDNEMFKGFIKRAEGLKATHDFIRIVNKDFRSLYLNDPAEKAHYLAAQNNSDCKKEALEILNRLEKENNGLSNFQLYYKALAREDIALMELARDSFLKSGDLFYAELPKRYMKKRLITTNFK